MQDVDAVFSPIPGKRESSLTSRVIAGGNPSLRLRLSGIDVGERLRMALQLRPPKMLDRFIPANAKACSSPD